LFAVFNVKKPCNFSKNQPSKAAGFSKSWLKILIQAEEKLYFRTLVNKDEFTESNFDKITKS
jgi:hypothetical protein